MSPIPPSKPASLWKIYLSLTNSAILTLTLKKNYTFRLYYTDFVRVYVILLTLCRREINSDKGFYKWKQDFYADFKVFNFRSLSNPHFVPECYINEKVVN